MIHSSATRERLVCVVIDISKGTSLQGGHLSAPCEGRDTDDASALAPWQLLHSCRNSWFVFPAIKFAHSLMMCTYSNGLRILVGTPVSIPEDPLPHHFPATEYIVKNSVLIALQMERLCSLETCSRSSLETQGFHTYGQTAR
jgi:hypothetical protein